MVIIHLKNDVEIIFKDLDGDRLIPEEDHLEICLHDTTPEQQHVHCTCEPEDLQKYVFRSSTSGHLIIPNHLIRGIEAFTKNQQFLKSMLSSAMISDEDEEPQGFSLN